MICQQLSTLLGFDCSPLTEEGDIALVSTPFKFDDGDALPVYVEVVHDQVRFFDDGQALMHFIGRGVRLENKKHTSFIATAASKNGATFTEDGSIEVWAPMSEASSAFAKYLSSMIALSAWEREQRGTNTDTALFVEEVAMALRAWKPHAEITLDPMFEGISGRMHRLDFLIEGQAVIATGSHPNSVSSVLHKLLDVHGRLANSELPFLVIIDDRPDPEGADRESLILQSIAKVMPFRALEANAQKSDASH